MERVVYEYSDESFVSVLLSALFKRFEQRKQLIVYRWR